MVNLFIGMSEVYHDYYRWPLRDKRVFDKWRHESEWGRLFDRYSAGPPLWPTMPSSTMQPIARA
jgi:hypothetical protein